MGAAALSFSLASLPARADDGNSTSFDLGVDVSQIPLDRPDVNAFLAQMEAYGVAEALEG